MATSREVPELLNAVKAGDPHAKDRLSVILYRELRRIAAHLLASERQGHTLQPTALVHEAYLKLANSAIIDSQDRTHFLSVAACAMRQVLVDHARKNRRLKRGDGARKLSLEEAIGFAPEASEDMLSLDIALSKLEKLDGRQCRIVELHAFAGLTFDEIGHAFQLSTTTVKRDWTSALAFLGHEMGARRDSN